MKTNFDGIKKTAEKNFQDEITTKTDYWYYINWTVIILAILVAPLIVFQDYFINLFTK